ncbi:hypothetical protein ABKN59_006584 [Abortiporus biennis]
MDLPLPSFEVPDWPPEDDGEEYEEGEDEDEDYDAEAEEIARRLGDQLLADIAKAQIEAGLIPATSSSGPSQPSTSVSQPEQTQPVLQSTTHSIPSTQPPIHSGAVPTSKRPASKAKKQEAALETMRTILSFASKDTQVRATLSASIITTSTSGSSNVFDTLTRCVSAMSISKDTARPLREAMLSLAKSENLFSSMRNSDAPSLQLDKGKRKRDQADDGQLVDDGRFLKKAAIEYPDLLSEINGAVRVVLGAFSSIAPTNRPPDPAFVSSIHQQLHQIFLFAVTSGPRARPENASSLQELAGLIQMLGILSSIPIGSLPPPPPATSPWNSDQHSTSPPPDIGTAVYPCLGPSCHKVFHRLYSLRTHQRVHTLLDRPYRCPQCPASFLRNHDLKRHLKLHERKAWKCCGCDKVFSRRDAIKRHKDTKGRTGGKGGDGEICATADILEVEVDREEGEEEVSRRAKIWNGIVANQLAGAAATEGLHSPQDGVMEEGEISLQVIHEAQNVVLRLHTILQSHVATALGTNAPPHLPPHMAPPQPSGHPHPGFFSSPQPTLPTPPPHQPQPMASLPAPPAPSPPPPVELPTSSIAEEQTKLLEQAIAQAASAAQAQAEAEAALEEEDDDFEDDDDGHEET